MVYIVATLAIPTSNYFLNVSILLVELNRIRSSNNTHQKKMERRNVCLSIKHLQHTHKRKRRYTLNFTLINIGIIGISTLSYVQYNLYLRIILEMEMRSKCLHTRLEGC